MIFRYPKISKYRNFDFDFQILKIFVDEGSVYVEIGGVNKKTLKSPDVFGELALLYNAPRSASIKCETKTTFWVIDRTTFKSVNPKLPSKNPFRLWKKLQPSNLKKTAIF